MSAECIAENIPPGYKKTEVGVIPEDWDIYTIQQLIDDNFIIGHLDGNHGEFYPRSHEFKSFGIPYITANDFCGNKVSFKDCKYLSEERASKFRKGIAKNGDVLFAHNATVGPTTLLSTTLDYVILSTTATYFRCNPDKLVNSFVLYLLQSPYFVRQYQGIMSQSTRNQVPITAQRKLMVVLPATLAEQETIAEALSDADAFIESLEQLIAKKRQIKQGAMQELLTVKKRLPGFSGEWETKRLGDIAEIRDGTHQTPKYVENGIPFFSVENVTNDDFVNTKFISEVEHHFLTRSFKIEKGDILMTRIGSIGNCKFINWDVNASFYVSLALLKIRKGYSAEFICHYSKTAAFKKDVELHSLQSAIPKKINLGPISDVQVKLPTNETEQTAIASILSDMDSEIIALEEKLAKAHQVKQGMMQELLTGKIRLI